MKQEDLKNKILEERYNAVSNNLKMIAHHWRQPLAAICNNASYLIFKESFDEISQEERKDNLNEIINNSKHLSNIISLLSQEIENKTDYCLLKTEEIKLILNKYKFINKKIKLNFNDNGLKIINTNISIFDLSFIVDEILRNSFDISVKKEIKNVIFDINLLKEDDFLVIEIRDNCGGIDEDFINSIYDPYFTSKHPDKNIGLSLFLSYKLLKESYNGLIYSENENDGLKTIVKIPLKD